MNLLQSLFHLKDNTLALLEQKETWTLCPLFSSASSVWKYGRYVHIDNHAKHWHEGEEASLVLTTVTRPQNAVHFRRWIKNVWNQQFPSNGVDICTTAKKNSRLLYQFTGPLRESKQMQNSAPMNSRVNQPIVIWTRSCFPPAQISMLLGYNIIKCSYLILIRYCARATASGFPVIVMVLSVAPPSRSSQFEIRIMAPLICL
jgi:hypothetical protein